ncbi:MAG: hypothetical protein M3R14_01040 [Acidobacteriota bacterium]|nr:hypothetical protein [Acidobacteriota bacterium]
MKKVILAIGIVLTLSIWSFAQENLLEKVPELQKLAGLASGGALGCGSGEVTLVTSNGEIKGEIFLDPIHVFGKKIVVSDLIKLLEARVESNKTTVKNQMSGKVSTLVSIALYTLTISKDSKVIPVIAELLEDKDKVICNSAIVALLRLATMNEELKNEIEKISFPKEVVQNAKERSQEIPNWVKIKEGN